jgi:TPR repeat protein
VSAIATFTFAVLWLVAPWISSQIRSSSGSAAQPQVQVPSKSPHLPGPANDLASLRKVAERGDPAAQFALGARYATGEEVKQDYAEAVKWFTLAAEQGHILAQATLGAYYWAGRGVPQDLNKALLLVGAGASRRRPGQQVSSGCARLPHEPEPGAGGATAGQRLAQ